MAKEMPENQFLHRTFEINMLNSFGKLLKKGIVAILCGRAQEMRASAQPCGVAGCNGGGKSVIQRRETSEEKQEG